VTDYVFVSDFFVEDYVGGAELTSEALIRACPGSIRKIKSSVVTKDRVNQFKSATWIFGNFTHLPKTILMFVIKSGIKYHIVEYDFKFCQLRSPEKHMLLNNDCKCEEETSGKLISLFFSKSECIWFMSQKQKGEYLKRFPFLRKNNSFTLSSIFDPALLQRLVKTKNKKNDEWVILRSDSWIKGMGDCIRFAKENDLTYKLVGGVSHDEMLKILSESKGLIFLPKGGDTCPRLVIEAFLLGCELELNENVMHKDEDWFTKTRDHCVEYLLGRPGFFWKVVQGELK
jgi:hypothetical protein